MLLPGPRLQQLITDGVIDADPLNVNGASIDVCLGSQIKLESMPLSGQIEDVDLERGQSPYMVTHHVSDGIYFSLRPGDFILAHTVEEFNLPDTLSMDFMLRSSVARAGLEHLHAGFGDPGFNGAQLTLEFFNANKYHNLLITAGMRIGQIRFYEHQEAGDYSYRHKGRYNRQRGVQQTKGTS